MLLTNSMAIRIQRDRLTMTNPCESYEVMVISYYRWGKLWAILMSGHSCYTWMGQVVLATLPTGSLRGFKEEDPLNDNHMP